MRALARFRKFAVVTCAATYLLIWLGGLVRVSGAGLGCPDWPKCFGGWIPPTDPSQVPADQFDPALFNPTLAWIEYVNRLTGVTIGFLILGTAIIALLSLRRFPSLVWPTVAATLLVAFQGWLGSVVVSSQLESWIITAHLVLALVIISLLVWVSVKAWLLENPNDGLGARYPRFTGLSLGVVWLLALSQIALGTLVRGSIEHQIKAHPLRGDRQLIDGAGNQAHAHLVLGFLVALVIVWLCIWLLRNSRDPSWLVRFGAWTSLALVLLQILIGMGFVGFGIPPTVQLFHAWVASLLIGSLLVLYAGTTRGQELEGGTP